MGNGIAYGVEETADALGLSADEKAQLTEGVENLRDQLLIALVAREPHGRVRLPVATVDGTGKYILTMTIDQPNQVFVLEAKRKQ